MDGDREAAERFLHHEARLADEGRYAEWEQLWCDEALYWLPAGDESPDTGRRLSYIYDNRKRLASRVRQLMTGKHYTQVPPSRTRRLISNTIVDREGDVLVVTANFLLVESRGGVMQLWAGQTLHRLQETPDGFRIAMKKITLVNNDGDLPTLSFLI